MSTWEGTNKIIVTADPTELFPNMEVYVCPIESNPAMRAKWPAWVQEVESRIDTLFSNDSRFLFAKGYSSEKVQAFTYFMILIGEKEQKLSNLELQRYIEQVIVRRYIIGS